MQYGHTPLHDACARGHVKVVDYLAEKGANKLATTWVDFDTVSVRVLRRCYFILVILLLYFVYCIF